MNLALDIFTVSAVSAGAFFFLAGTVGLLRFPDSLTRLHALTKVDNLFTDNSDTMVLAAAGKRTVRRLEAGEHLAAGSTVRRDCYTAHRRRGSTTRTT